MPKNKKNKKTKKEKSAYKFALPAAMFIQIAGAVLIWYRISSFHADELKGRASDGMTYDVLIDLLHDPVIAVSALASVIIFVLSFASVVRAINEKRQGGALLLFFLLLFAFAAGYIVYSAVASAIK